MYHLYCSHSVGSLKLIVLLGGRFASCIPQRRNSRQSNSGSASFCGGVLISPGDAPPRIRAATSAVFRLSVWTERRGPPTIPPPS